MSENSPKDGKSGRPKEVKAERLKAKGKRPQAEKSPAAARPAPPEKEDKGERLNLPAGRQGAKGVKKPEAGSPKSEPEKPSTAARPAPPKLTTDHSQLTTEMEVHHHPELHHEKKPWKEYLLEGLMIFFAVFMGFIAENIRESIDNNEHARQLTSQLVRDLKADIAQLHAIDSAERQILKANDSLFNLLQQPLAKTDTKAIQRLINVSHSMWIFHPSLGAIGAIKNEMHLKQFANSEMIGYIAGYEGHINLINTAQDINLQYQHTYLDPFLRLHFTPANLYAVFNKQPVTSQMRNLTQEDLTQLSADMVLVRTITNEMIRDDEWCKADAVQLLKYATKQYHLENE